MKIKEVNIGLMITSRIKQLHMSKSEFGRKIGVPQQNVNRILERANIDTEKLIRICEVLDYNFFELYTDSSFSDQYQATGSHAILAKNIEKVDNREMVEIKETNDEQTKIIFHWCLLKFVNRNLLNSVFISFMRYLRLKMLSHFSNDYIGDGTSKSGSQNFHECRTIHFQPDC